MATVTDKSAFRGFAIPHPSTLTSSCIWAAESSYDQAGNIAGIPEDQDGSSMVLRASGTQTASSELRIRTQRGGIPGRGNEATFIRQRNGDTDWLGWDGPTAIAGVEYLGGGSFIRPSLLALESGRVLCVCNAEASPNQVGALFYEAAANNWSSNFAQGAEIVTHASFTDLNHAYADAVQLPSGRVLCFSMHESATTADELQVDVHYSDDDGDTWAEFASECLRTPILHSDAEPWQLRVEYNPATAEFLLLVWAEDIGATNALHLYQYASRDGGSTFENVAGSGGVQAVINGTDDMDQSAGGDVVVVDGVFVVMSTNPGTLTASETGWYVWRLASAFESLGSGTGGENFASSNFTISTNPGETAAACVDDDGTIWWLVHNDAPSVENVACFYSTDGGVSWQTYAGGTGTSGYGSVFQGGVTDQGRPYLAAATFHRGRVIFVCQNAHDGGFDDEMHAIYLGGWSTVTRPYIATIQSGTYGYGRKAPEHQAGFERTYIPWQEPDQDGWAIVQNGTNSASLTSGALNLTTTGSSRRLYRLGGSVTSGEASRLYGIARANSGETQAQMLWDDGTVIYQAQVEIDGTNIQLVDAVAVGNTQLGTAAHGAGSDPVEFILDVEDDNATLYWRVWSSDSEKTWSELSGTLTDLGTATGSTTRAEFGINNSATGDADWFAVGYVSGDEAGSGLNNFTNPDNLHGHTYGAGTAQSVWVGDGVSAWAVDGPTAAGNDWHIDTRYEYGIERVVPQVSPSPEVKWRSSSTTASMAIAYRLDDFDDAYLNGAQTLILEGINFRQCQLQKYTGGAWSDVRTINAYEDIDFERKGAVVRPNVTSGTQADSPWVEHNELVGGAIEFPNGDVRRIVSNTAGHISEVNGLLSTANICLIRLEGVDDGENASGTGKIWFPRVSTGLVIQSAEAIRIQINDDASPVAPPEGYFTIGRMFFGSMHPFGADYTQERTVSVNPNTSITTSRDGRRRARVNGPTRRAVSFSFPAIDMTEFSGEDTITTGSVYAGNYNGIAVRDEPSRLAGMIEYLRGPGRLIAYMPYIPNMFPPSATSWTHTYQRIRGTFIGRITSPITLTQVAGDEQVDEVLSIGTVTVEEEV